MVCIKTSGGSHAARGCIFKPLFYKSLNNPQDCKNKITGYIVWLTFFLLDKENTRPLSFITSDFINYRVIKRNHVQRLEIRVKSTLFTRTLHPWDSKKMAIVDRWLFFRGQLFIKSSKCNLKVMVGIGTWSLFESGR